MGFQRSYGVANLIEFARRAQMGEPLQNYEITISRPKPTTPPNQPMVQKPVWKPSEPITIPGKEKAVLRMKLLKDKSAAQQAPKAKVEK